MLKSAMAKLKGLKAVLLKAIVPATVAGTLVVGGIVSTNSVEQALLIDPCASYGKTNSGGGSLDGVEREIYQYFSSKGYGDATIAGLLGNAYCESSMRPNITGAAYGLWQWDVKAGNAAKLKAYAQNKGVDWTTVALQCEYLDIGLGSYFPGRTGKVGHYSGGGAYGWPQKVTLEQFKTQKNPQTAAAIFCRVYERPFRGVSNKRKQMAQQYYDQMKSGGGSGGLGVTDTVATDGKATAKGLKIASYAKAGKSTKPTTANYCAAWVSGVYQAAGYGYVGGNAIDMWNNHKGTGSTSMKKIPPGAIVCGSGSGSMGAKYGHVGIYIGGGMVANNVGHLSIENMTRWCSWQKATCQGHTGWIGWVFPGKKGSGAAGVSYETEDAFDTDNNSKCEDGIETVSDVPYYNQGDPPWGPMPYWGGTVASSGCGLCAMASALSGITGKRVTPDKLIASGANGRSSVMLNYVQAKYGIRYQVINKSAESYANALKAGKMIYVTIKGSCASGPWKYNTNGHYILLYGYNDGKCKIMDSSGAGRAVAGQFCINISDAASWSGRQVPYAIWGDVSAAGETTIDSTWTGSKLTKKKGVNQGPSGKETYYNMNMSAITKSLTKKSGWVYADIKKNGYEKNVKGKYSVRKDGVKMFGPYVMVAANLKVRPRGSLVPTSLGTGIVVDTGGFASKNPTQLDIAVTW